MQQANTMWMMCTRRPVSVLSWCVCVCVCARARVSLSRLNRRGPAGVGLITPDSTDL